MFTTFIIGTRLFETSFAEICRLIKMGFWELICRTILMLPETGNPLMKFELVKFFPSRKYINSNFTEFLYEKEEVVIIKSA